MRSQNMQKIEQTQVEPVSIERDVSSVSPDGLTVEANGLQEDLTDAADTFDVTGFKCVKCNLVHMHDTTKHQLTDSFDVSADIASVMNYNSVCHCGPHEAARRGSDFGIDESSARSIAEGAPIPTDISREMDEEIGSL